MKSSVVVHVVTKIYTGGIILERCCWWDRGFLQYPPEPVRALQIQIPGLSSEHPLSSI